MKKLFFFCSFLALGATKPNGYYHQEYSYKSSSASYKNNELQHKNDDQGFYSKDGDLEGRLKPKVNSQSQHSEYRNPHLAGGSGKLQSAGYSGASGANYLTNSEGLFGGASGVQNVGPVDGYASSDRVLDLSNVYNTRVHSNRQGYAENQGFGSSQSNYGSLHSGNYGYAQGANGIGYVRQGTGSYATNANLNAIMQRLQADMTRQLEHAIYNQYRTSGYTSSVSNSQMNTDIRLLEEELRRNLTRQLQEDLRTQYGSNTYTVVEGRPSTVPNYSTQELAALTRRLEDDLINRLHQSVRTTYNRESSNTFASSSNTYRPVVVYPVTTSRPYYERPMITTPNRYSVVPGRETISSYPGNLVVVTPNNIRYTPIPNPESLTQIASRTQADINSYLDTALQNLYATYLQTERGSYYTITDFDNQVNRIKEEILRNLTYNLEDEIRKNYGQQILKDDYYYSVSSNGDMSSQYNYNLRDYENLKKQVEDNLLRKLNQTTNTYRDQYTQRQQSQYRESSNTYTVTYRPTYYTSGSQLYDYSDLQRQLSQQLQNALNQRRYSQSTSYSTSYNPQAYQISLDELSRELQRNLTEQLSNYRAQASSSSSSSYGYMSGSHGGNADFESMKNQLQNQLMQQLRQGLQNQHHYSASASYSASSSSSANANYGMRQTYGSYPSTCLNGCGRRKRDLNQYSYNTGKRHGVKSIRRNIYPQGQSNSESSFSSPRYLHYPQELSYPAHHGIQFSGDSSYSRHSQSEKHNTRNEEVEPVEDLGFTNQETRSTSRTEQRPVERIEDSKQQQLEQLPCNVQYKYLDLNDLEPKIIPQPLQKIQDDLTQQQMLGNNTTQKIIANAEKLGNQNDSTQQLESPHHRQLLEGSGRHVNELNQYDQEAQLNMEQLMLGQQLEDQNLIEHSHKPKHYEQELEGQFNFDQQTLGKQLEDQNVITHLDKPKHHDQELESQLTLGQQALQQQIEDQNILGDLYEPKHRHREVEGELTLGQQSLGQELEDQNLIGQLHEPEHHDQEPESQLTIGQQIEDQNLLGHLYKPNHHRQKLEGQLTLSPQELGQQLEDQNIIGQLHKPKHLDQELESQLTLGLQAIRQVEDKDIINKIIGHLHKPKHLDQEVESPLTLGQQDQGQQLEDQNIIGHLQKPKHHDQEHESPLTLGQQDQGQQLEDQNIIGHLQKPKHHDQELESPLTLGQQDQGQQLEDQNIIGHLQKPKHYYQELESQLTLGQQALGQQVEEYSIGYLHKPKQFSPNFQQQIEDNENGQDLTQQLELDDIHNSQAPQLEYQNRERQSNKHSNIQQQLEEDQNDLSQQLELSNPRNLRTTPVPDQQSELESVQQQIKDEDDLQRLEIESEPTNKHSKQTLETQQVEDDLTQQLELSNAKYQPPGADQQVQKQDDLDRNLELSRGPEQKPEAQEQDSNLILTDGQPSTENQVTGIHDPEQATDSQKLETVNNDNLRLVQTEKQTTVVQNSGEQKLELSGSSQDSNKISNITPHQTSVQQIEDLNQQLELTDLQNPQKPVNQRGEQLENDFTKLDFPRGIASPGSELSFSSDSSNSDISQQSERTNKHHSRSSSSSHRVVTQVSQSSHYPTQVFGDNGSTEQRSFTNGHSGHLAGTPYPRTISQTSMDSYENALKQQEALMNLLKRKVEDAHTAKQDLYGRRTIKKTVSVNGKVVDVQESSQLIQPNGDVLEVQEGSAPETSFSKNTYDRQFGSQIPRQYHPNTQSTRYSGNTFRSTYHELGNPTEFSGNSQWFSHGEMFEPSPLSAFEKGFQGQTEVSGKATRRVFHFVNGKPISASEQIQILKPNGEIIERQHELPTGEFNSFSHGFANTETGLNAHGLHFPRTYFDSQNSIVSKHTLKKTDISSSNQDEGSNDEQVEIHSGVLHNVELADNFNTTPLKHSTVSRHNYGTKTTKHIEEPLY